LLDGPGRRTARVGQVITSDLYVVQDVDGPSIPRMSTRSPRYASPDPPVPEAYLVPMMQRAMPGTR